MDEVGIFDIFRRKSDLDARIGLDFMAAAGLLGIFFFDSYGFRQFRFFDLFFKFPLQDRRIAEDVAAQVLRREGIGRFGIFH